MWTCYIHFMRITRTTYLEIITLLFLVLFVYAAVAKLIDHERFVAQIGQARLLTPIAGIVSWFIPGLELLIVVFLLIPRMRLTGLYFSFGLMMMFTLYIAITLTLQEHVPCSCGGVLEKMGWKEHLVFNIGFVALAFAGIWLTLKTLDTKKS